VTPFRQIWLIFTCFIILSVASCTKDAVIATEIPSLRPDTLAVPYQGDLSLNPELVYAGQRTPDYILLRNPAEAEINDAKAILGRVLFYDQNLSSNRTISCAGCHRQSLAFGDNTIVSNGVNGTTRRHAMRLFNVRFTAEPRFFWDERAGSLRQQVLDPIRDHTEMGFSGEQGSPAFDDLLRRLDGLEYYKDLFEAAYGDQNATEAGISEGLTHFIRSIQSFDSKYDEGQAVTANGGIDFPNFSPEENRGKLLFGTALQYGSEGERIGGGFGCGNCHHTPEFSIDANAGNNGVTGRRGGGVDLSATRAPSLRNLFLPDGAENGPFMHDGTFSSVGAVLDHYDNIPGENPGLDERLLPTGRPQQLNVLPEEKASLLAFLKTLTGKAIFTDERWADPFER